MGFNFLYHSIIGFKIYSVKSFYSRGQSFFFYSRGQRVYNLNFRATHNNLHFSLKKKCFGMVVSCVTVKWSTNPKKKPNSFGWIRNLIVVLPVGCCDITLII